VGRMYRTVATGGTFDHIHKGHIALLDKSFEVGDQVVIGVPSDEFAARMGKKPDYPYDERVAELQKLLRDRYPGRKFIIAELFDFFGPGIASPEVQALVASEETAERAPIANAMRKAKGFPPLETVVIGKVLADDGVPISSTRIRKGEIDAEGHVVKG
jgi:cytidyltransferase-like protein